MAGPADDALNREFGDAAVVREVFEQMPVLLISMEDPGHRIVAVNAACKSYLGRSSLAGIPVQEVMPEVAGQQTSELLERVRATGQPETGREWWVRFNRGGGAQEACVDFSVFPWRAPDGVIIGVVASFTDMTGQVSQPHAAQQRAAEAERRYLAARDVVIQLQEALLPTALPVLPWARLAARYLVASQDQAAGGDWFDALPLADGRLALIVGDVVGHGVTASAAMGKLRAVLNELLMAEPDLSAVLARAEAFAARTPGLHAATMALAVLDPGSGRLTSPTCGHPPPLIIGTDGKPRFLPGTGTGPLGTGSPPALTTGTVQPGELLLLYSDGLIERPDRTLSEAMDELANVAADAAASRALLTHAAPAAADRVCQLTVELLTRTGYADDATTLAVQRLAEPVPALELQLAAEIGALHVARDRFDEWLTHADPVAEDRDGLRLAITEIVTNVIEHAYLPGRSGPLEVRAALCDDGYLECHVIDHGAWLPPDLADEEGGHGLMVAGHMVEQLHVRHPAQAPDGRGTEVILRHRLRHPAVLAADPRAPADARTSHPSFGIDIETCGSEPVATVRGPVDITTADRLARRLLTACRGGTLPLTVDLSQVNFLASAGVHALYQVSAQLTAHQQALTFRASADSGVQAVLQLTGLAQGRLVTSDRQS